MVTAERGAAQAKAVFGDKVYDCVIGRGGPVAAEDKREGDGCTPTGNWRLVALFYNARRRTEAARLRQLAAITGKGPVEWQELTPDMGWCDAPGDPLYNKLCEVGYAASHEVMVREDTAYDYVGVLDYNLDGAVAPDGRGRGSAIFLHVWREGAEHTAGCVALRLADLEEVLGGGVESVEVRVE